MAELAGQIGLDFDAKPAPEPKSVLGGRRSRPGAHTVDAALKLALELLLRARHTGRSQAATWETLRDELVAEGRPMCVVRRLQEAGEALLDEGKPVVGLSSDGVFWAETAAEVELSLRESEKRARKSLRRRNRLKRVFLEMLGQEALRAVEGTP